MEPLLNMALLLQCLVSRSNASFATGPDEVGLYVIGKDPLFTEATFDNFKTGLEIKFQFSRQIRNIILVSYLPTILMNIINQATNFFVGDAFFGDVVAVNS